MCHLNELNGGVGPESFQAEFLKIVLCVGGERPGLHASVSGVQTGILPVLDTKRHILLPIISHCSK